MSRFIAVDWGTTNRRIYRIEDGAVAWTAGDDVGVKAMAGRDWGAEIDAMRARAGDLPMLLAGMVGSTIGWHEAPYVAAPAGIDALAAGLFAVNARTAIVPGLSSVSAERLDVMRGEEVQLLGAVAAGLAPPDALICQPGTHCKWARMAGGRVDRFVTAMTGELFALLKGHSVLASALGGTAAPGAAFDEGVEVGRRGDLAAALFEVRAGTVLGRFDAAGMASRTSGILIGADVAARVMAGETVHILSEGALADLYARAVELVGATPIAAGSEAAFIAGIVAIQERRA